MTSFRLLIFFCLLSLCCSPVLAEQPTAQLVQLQQENAALQRQVKRLEAQVTAMREELNTPAVTQIVGGIGYIVGIFGIAGWVAVRKKNRQGN